MKTNRRHAGFTLVEVMVAVAIIAIALPSLLIVMMGHIDGSGWLRDKLQAQWVAENRLVEMRLQNRSAGTIETQDQSGEEELAGRKWLWRSQAKAFEQEEFVDIYGVEVSVWFADESAKDDAPLVTVVGIMRLSNGQTISRPAPEKNTLPETDGKEGSQSGQTQNTGRSNRNRGSND